MKWKDKESKLGTIRIVTRYCIFPRCINGECRWLQKSRILQKYSKQCGGYDADIYYWEDLRWYDEGWYE
jgi:hypothetical protein